LIAAAVMWLCLSACEGSVYEEEIIPAEGKTIEFYAPIDKPATKAAIEGTGFPVGGVFGIFAYQHGFNGSGSIEPFENPDPKKVNVVAFNNTAVTNKGEGKLSYSPRVLWPENLHEGLSFFAYYPHSKDYAGIIHAEQHETEEQLDITYSVPANASNQVDLMYAASTSIISDVNPVGIEFQHSLARLRFRAKVHENFPENDGNGNANIIKVTGIKIVNAATLGVLNITATDPYAAWTINPGNQPETPLAIDFNSVEINKSDYTSLEGEMLVIPQKVENSGIEMQVTVTINGNPKTYTAPVAQEWIMNQSVTYQLSVNWDGISVSALVDEWIPNGQYVVFDGSYYLKFHTDPVIKFGSDGGEIILNCETNYDGKTGIQSGLILNEKPSVEWCTVELGDDITPDSDIDSRQISIQCDENIEGERETSFILRAGNLFYKIFVYQSTNEWVTLTAPIGNEYPINGEEHSFRLKAIDNKQWKIDRIEDPYQILLPSRSSIGGSVPWVGSTANDATFYFFLKANAQPGRKAEIIVVDPEGSLSQKNIVITAVE